MRVASMFSGIGGIDLGFLQAASESFSRNFPTINMIQCDIKDITEEKLQELIGKQPVDLVIGGPPCQSFSTVGQRLFDDKAKLYQEYFRMLEIIKPKMFLFENVKGLLSMRETFYKTDKDGNIMYEETSLRPQTSWSTF